MASYHRRTRSCSSVIAAILTSVLEALRRGYAAGRPRLATVRDVPSTTRGPLPPGVYWRRRLAVLTLALLLVLGIGKVLVVVERRLLRRRGPSGRRADDRDR